MTIQTVEGSTAVEIWDGSRQAATIYTRTGGLQIVCEPGYVAEDLQIELRATYVSVALHRQD